MRELPRLLPRGRRACRGRAHRRSRAYDTCTWPGVPAYSTLGWFDDPLLSSFIRYPDIELARLIFHELAHQIVYVGNDSTFRSRSGPRSRRPGSRAGSRR
ncbi:MAG: aminopeptidase [Betaproteobacteria bacterium]|nr:aminopeptidase [Betaproteobacteria bacterium]